MTASVHGVGFGTRRSELVWDWWSFFCFFFGVLKIAHSRTRTFRSLLTFTPSSCRHIFEAFYLRLSAYDVNVNDVYMCNVISTQNATMLILWLSQIKTQSINQHVFVRILLPCFCINVFFNWKHDCWKCTYIYSIHAYTYKYIYILYECRIMKEIYVIIPVVEVSILHHIMRILKCLILELSMSKAQYTLGNA